MKVMTINITKQNGIQAINIPDDMKINDDKVYLKKIGNSIYVIPYHSAWQNLIDSTTSFTNDFMETRNQPNEQNRESFE